jgi:hypothetical protein
MLSFDLSQITARKNKKAGPMVTPLFPPRKLYLFQGITQFG